MENFVLRTKHCNGCDTEKSLSSFYLKYKDRDIRHSLCKECSKESSARSASKNAETIKLRRSTPEAKHKHNLAQKVQRKRHKKRHLIQGIRQRCLKRNIPFDISVEDIDLPEYCPVLGILMGQEDRDTWYSVDRLIPEKGYVRGNVLVISMRANRIKYNATTQEIRKIVKFLESHYGQK